MNTFIPEVVKIPLTAVVHSNIIPDTWTVAKELDGIGENAYLDHPSFKAGTAWVGKSFFSNKNYIRETGSWSLAPHMARYKWDGKPLICREWATCWPNEYRCFLGAGYRFPLLIAGL